MMHEAIAVDSFWLANATKPLAICPTTCDLYCGNTDLKAYFQQSIIIQVDLIIYPLDS